MGRRSSYYLRDFLNPSANADGTDLGTDVLGPHPRPFSQMGEGSIVRYHEQRIMCGIAGLVSTEPEGRMRAMLDRIEHRGRDDEGVWTSAQINDAGQHVCFGHRRLSIIDTSSAGHQPMLSADRRFVVTLNGEIYNYRELRAELTAKGHRFRTQTDTEVLLAAWAEWAEDSLTRLNGMFAFALWDNDQRTLFLARDRVGIKPLYYAECRKPDRQGGPVSLAFASEVKAILATGFIKPELDTESLHQFLTFLWTPDPNT